MTVSEYKEGLLKLIIQYSDNRNALEMIRMGWDIVHWPPAETLARDYSSLVTTLEDWETCFSSEMN